MPRKTVDGYPMTYRDHVRIQAALARIMEELEGLNAELTRTGGDMPGKAAAALGRASNWLVRAAGDLKVHQNATGMVRAENGLTRAQWDAMARQARAQEWVDSMAPYTEGDERETI